MAGNADYTAYVAARPDIHRGSGPTPAGGRVGSKPLKPRARGAHSRSPTWACPRTAAGTTPSPLQLHGGRRRLRLRLALRRRPGEADLAVIPAADAKQYSLSHFDNSDIWFAASYDQNVKTGWLGRWIDRNGDAEQPAAGGLDRTALSKAIRTAVNPVCAISSLPMTGFTSRARTAYGGSDQHRPQRDDRRLSGVAADPANAYLARSRADVRPRVRDVAEASAGAPTPTPARRRRRPGPIVYPNTGTLSTRLKTAATLLAANLGTRIITIHWGSFDTHTGQLGVPGPADRRALARAGRVPGRPSPRGIEHRVATLVFSEFGRRVQEAGELDRGGDGPRRGRADVRDGQRRPRRLRG